jgi:hypothetical protein
MLGLQRPGGKQAAEFGLAGIVEPAKINLRDFAGRQDQRRHLRIVIFRIRAKRRAYGSLVGWLPHTAAHPAASAIRRAAAAGRARRLDGLARSERPAGSKRLRRNRRANGRHAHAHREQSGNDGTDWLRLAIHDCCVYGRRQQMVQ